MKREAYKIKKSVCGNVLVLQWWGLHTFTVEDMDSIPCQGTESQRGWKNKTLKRTVFVVRIRFCKVSLCVYISICIGKSDRVYTSKYFVVEILMAFFFLFAHASSFKTFLQWTLLMEQKGEWYCYNLILPSFFLLQIKLILAFPSL